VLARQQAEAELAALYREARDRTRTSGRARSGRSAELGTLIKNRRASTYRKSSKRRPRSCSSERVHGLQRNKSEQCCAAATALAKDGRYHWVRLRPKMRCSGGRPLHRRQAGQL